VFDKLLQLLRFGRSYQAIVDTTCSDTTIGPRRDEWTRLGVFTQLQRIALEPYDRIVGLVLDQSAVDGSIVQMPPVPRPGLPAVQRVGVGHQPAHKQTSPLPTSRKGPSVS
jgi:hypothetical protein